MKKFTFNIKTADKMNESSTLLQLSLTFEYFLAIFIIFSDLGHNSDSLARIRLFVLKFLE